MTSRRISRARIPRNKKSSKDLFIPATTPSDLKLKETPACHSTESSSSESAESGVNLDIVSRQLNRGVAEERRNGAPSSLRRSLERGRKALVSEWREQQPGPGVDGNKRRILASFPSKSNYRDRTEGSVKSRSPTAGCSPVFSPVSSPDFALPS